MAPDNSATLEGDESSFARRHIEVVADRDEGVKPENVTNRRSRQEAVVAVINEECSKYYSKLRLLIDRVYGVREMGMEAIVSWLRLCTPTQLTDLMAIIVTAFVRSSHWRSGQI